MSKLRGITVFLVATLLMLPIQPGQSAEIDQSLMGRIESMERGLKVLKQQLDESKRQAKAAKKDVEKVKKELGAESRKLSKWHLAGYAAVAFATTDAGDVGSTFGSLKFNPVVHYQYNDLVLFEGELEFGVEDDGGTELELEYATINILAHDWVTFVAGKYISPVGQFQERLHPAWINKLPDAPAGFGHGGAQPLNDLGAMVRGGIPVSDMILSYALAVGNGPRIGHHGPELEAFGMDDNDNKAVSGRIGIIPIPHLEIGASFLTAKLMGEEAESGPATEGDYFLWGVDFSYTKGAWDVRGEYLKSELGSFYGQEHDDDDATSLIPKTDWEAWYLQVAYQLSGITKARFIKNLELVVHYGEFDVTGHGEFVEEARPEKRFSLGINYLFTPSLMLKTAVSSRDFKDGDVEDAIEFKAQLAYGF